MEKPYAECALNYFMMQRHRLAPLSFTESVLKDWRPLTVPLLVISDDESESPQYSATKITHPSSSRDPDSKRLFICLFFAAPFFLLLP